ncbi:hypothetical protein C1646_774016, partial [Rhizophagus diaphanus]
NIAREENRERVKKFQKSITYQWWDGNKYPRPWINDDLTDKIIRKIVETEGFVEEHSDVGELESSDNIEESNFMKNYMTIKELDDEEIIGELRKWYSTNVMECPLCNRMILIREAIEYDEEFKGKICKGCSEKEEENVKGVDKRIRELKKICDEMRIIVTEEELLRLTSMGYTDGEILDEEFIEIFQENKNELEKELKRKLNKLLREQAGIISSEESGEKSDNEESEKEDTDEPEKVGEILEPEEYEIWDENDKDYNENESGNDNENKSN